MFRIHSYIDSQYGIRLLFLVTFPILPFWYFHFWQLTIHEIGPWTPPANCTGYSTNYSQILYMFYVTDATSIFGETIQKIILLTEGILFRLIPSIILPVATIILIYEIKKAKKISLSKREESNDKSTKLVSFFTISFLIATAPIGMLYLVEFFVYDIVGLM